MKNIIFILVTLFYSLNTLAAMSCPENTNHGFTIGFHIDNPFSQQTGFSYVKSTHSHGNKEKELQYIWTNNRSFSSYNKIIDHYMETSGTYDVVLDFAPDSHGYGLLTYYVNDGINGWRKEESKEIYFLKQGAITVSSIQMELDCDAQVPDVEPEYSLDAKFQFGVQNCTSSECEIPINNASEYTIKPLVFLMPTIEQGSPDNDPPATMAVKSVDLLQGKVVIEQISPAGMGPAEQMSRISYLIMEPGRANFYGKEVIAGYVDTTEYQAASGNGRGWERGIKFSDWGGTTIFNPVVLTQQQALNRDDIFSTSAIKGVTRQDLDLALELGRGTDEPSNKRRVAFLASSEGTGVTSSGMKFEFGLKHNLSQAGTLAQSCQNLRIPFANQYIGQPGVVGMKQTRNGGDGGWIRRCELTPTDFSFVFDEDTLDSRKHRTAEDIGFFAFELPQQDIELDICKYVPQELVSNAYPAGVPHGSLNITPGTGSNVYLKSPQLDGNKKNWFAYLAYQGGESCINPDGSAALCKADPQKVFDNYPPQLEPFEVVSGSLNCTANCELFRDNNYQNVSIGSGAILTLNEGEYWFENIDFLGAGARLEVNGKAIVHYKTMRFSSGDIYINAPAGVGGTSENLLFIGHGNNSAIYLNGGVNNSLIYAYFYIEGVNYVGADGNLVQSIGFDIAGSDNEVAGGIASHSVAISGWRNSVRGRTELQCGGGSPNYTLIVTPTTDLSLTCDLQEVEFTVMDSGGIATDFDGQLRITTNLSRSGQAQWFSNSNGTGAGTDASLPYIATPVAGKVKLWMKSDFVGKVEVTGVIVDDDADPAFSSLSFVPFRFDINGGRIPVVAGKPASITIKAKSCRDDSNSDVAVGYHGKRTLKFATTYISPSQGMTSTNSHLLQLKAPEHTQWQQQEVELTFDRGVADAQLRYFDAGKTALTVHDPNCTLEQGCEILPQSRMLTRSNIGNWTRLEGTQSVWSRPYTFASCNAGEHLIESANGTAYSRDAFVSAGETFNVKAKPVIWLAGDAENIDSNGNATSMVDSSNMCSRAVTPGFYASDAPQATVALSIPSGEGIKPHSPTEAGAVSGTLTSAPLSNEAIKNSDFTAKWDEVGSIELRASTQGEYLGMAMNVGYRPVGRFYPYRFAIVSAESSKQYPYGQSFVYMNQPMPARFKVEAQNEKGDPTNNYGYFAPTKQVGLEIAAIDTAVEPGLVNDLGGRIDWGGLPNAWQKSWEGAYTTVNWFDLAFKREVKSAASQDKALTTEPDGPYDVALGIMREALSVGMAERIGYPAIDVDRVLFPCDLVPDGCRDADSRGVMEFASFNTRYGRMVLDDVAGRFDSELSIPLRVEYWDGVDFVTNKQDSRAAFDGKLLCKQILSQSDTDVTSTSYTQGSGNVQSGETRSGEFVAVPTDVKDDDGNAVIYREQVRFWQKVVSDKPKAIDNEPEIRCEAGSSANGSSYQPWLTFDWRGKGDESPHSTVTFGAYRGNDRVLYRGEKGINTMLD
ncbi:hypothetical protein PTW35_01635 [Photobacterium sp. DA100]|uniref:DUF6701 domain-containing protein n=1 Tax=Photobacterium sp. DA100 TaxID=3027472 RepID=UPI00247935F9|nr:DUF6701 domain-containing protein [Photobacterium sp. DA100]WEM42599.1 hypothetical protein PTW35_01635 [Photobacterium sp. DA100]